MATGPVPVSACAALLIAPPVPSATSSTAYLIEIPKFLPSPKYGSKSSALNEVARTISEIPASLAFNIWCSVNGTPATCNIGLGVLLVSGASLVPRPPTKRIALLLLVKLLVKLLGELFKLKANLIGNLGDSSHD